MEGDSAQDILLQQDAGLVQVTMNRPQVLNALSHDMIRVFSTFLPQWQSDESIKAVLIRGAGDRAFCAGGDIKSAYQIGKAFMDGAVTLAEAAAFFRDEYRLNRSLYHCDLPLVALMNGIVMGGGVGIAAPCRYRICSENTVFAMPETGIGFFPDIGGVFYLAQTPGYIGAYLAVTGDKIGAADMIYCGLATHYIPLADQEGLIDGLKGNAQDFALFLDQYDKAPPLRSVLAEKQSLIDRCFAHHKVEEIVSALRADSDAWAQEKADLILSRSPTSAKVALEHYRKASEQDFDTVIARDFVLAQNFLKLHDFYEGVRCALIDKGDVPIWQPACLEDVTDDIVRGYFADTGQNLD